MDRRVFFAVSVPSVAGLAAWFYGEFFPAESDDPPPPPQLVSIVEFSDSGARLGVRDMLQVRKSDRQWRRSLSYAAFHVTRRGATETAYTGRYWNAHDSGLYRCVCCDAALFGSDAKFDSSTGWPSFWRPLAEENIVTSEDRSLKDMVRTAVSCRRCEAHLGHVFDDGPEPTGLRYCINSAALRFVRLI